MIFRDSKGYRVDQTLDGGDSALRAGIAALCGKQNELRLYESNGWLVRCPSQRPWSNPKNFSRDQLMPFIAGASDELVRRVFYKAAKRFFFAQNFERDYPGTTKYPWPHKVDGKWRLFDFADPLFPNHIGALILAGRVRSFYPFLLLAYPVHLLSLILHSLGNHFEENQMIAECYLYGTLKLYTKWHWRWEEVSTKYWQRRNELEYHEMLVQFIKEQTNG